MRFILVDRIVELEPNTRITTIKNLTMAEEYLGDHFPCFPVMPGVLMLEAMTQAGAWLVRYSEDFAHSMVVLKEAVNIKYGQFVEPGQTLTVTAKILEDSENETKIMASGSLDGKNTLKGRLVLAKYNLADDRPHYAATDELNLRELRKTFDLLYKPADPATIS